MKVYLKKLKNEILPKFFSKTRLGSSFYYFAVNSQFRREMHAVLNGRVKHLKESTNQKESLYTLVRNIHRIEKGLLMIPRREVFAVDFLVETLDQFESIFVSNQCVVGSQIKWAYDVLKEYFQVTAQHIVIDRQRDRFQKIISDFGEGNLYVRSIPYRRNMENRPQISYEDFLQLTKFRRSVRWFLQERVPRDLVDKALLAANQSPSACNRQPFEYRIIDDPELLKEVVNIPMGIKGYQHNVPMLIVTIGNLDAYFNERDRHVIYIDASLSNMSLILALETLKLSSCSINWPDIEHLEEKMSKSLKLQPHQRPIMCMAVGYPDPEGMVAYSEKMNLDSLRKFN